MSAGTPISVLGAGYVGLVTAVVLAGHGHRTRIVEYRADRLASLRVGRAPIHEAGLQEALDAALAAGRLEVADALGDDLALVLVCVGTPIGDDGRSDLRQLESALRGMAGHLRDDSVLVIRSTLPVGGTRQALEWSGLPSSRVFTNPEFLRQGTAVADFARPTRIVIGRFDDADPAALDRVMALSEGFDAPRIVVGVEAAEVIKNGANAFLALKLSFANEIAALCEEAGADVDEVLAGITADPRIGSTYMRPSFGFGGSCLPKELMTLAVAGQDRGVSMHVTTAASAANHAQQDRFLRRIEERLGGVAGRTIGILGLAFKAGTDDVRESPSLRLAAALLEGGAAVRGYDPAAGENARRELPGLVLAYSPKGVFDGVDAVVVGTEWPEFRDLPWADWRSRMATPLVFDGRRLLDADALRDLGFEVVMLGDGRVRSTTGPVLR